MIEMIEPFLLRALLAGIGLGIVAAPLGCLVVWRRSSRKPVSVSPVMTGAQLPSP